MRVAITLSSFRSSMLELNLSRKRRSGRKGPLYPARYVVRNHYNRYIPLLCYYSRVL